MRRLSTDFEYDGGMDNEVIFLCNTMNSLPGIETSESCCGHGKTPFHIWFKVKATSEGLFFLTRCVDRRYWEYGHIWGIELSVGDDYKNNYLPVIYLLHSGDVVGKESYKQARSLVDNMNLHINHPAFLEYYELELEYFKLEYEDKVKEDITEDYL